MLEQITEQFKGAGYQELESSGKSKCRGQRFVIL